MNQSVTTFRKAIQDGRFALTAGRSAAQRIHHSARDAVGRSFNRPSHAQLFRQRLAKNVNG